MALEFSRRRAGAGQKFCTSRASGFGAADDLIIPAALSGAGFRRIISIAMPPPEV